MVELHDARGRRLYLTVEERATFLAAANKAPQPVRMLCGVLAHSGCRVSESLQLTPRRVDLAGPVLVFEALKKRGRGVYRAVPAPPRRRAFGPPLVVVDAGARLAAGQDGDDGRRHRGRAARDGQGVRHGYGVHAIGAGVPLNLLSRWMGHASLEVTAIYADVLGAEEPSLAARMWM